MTEASCPVFKLARRQHGSTTKLAFYIAYSDDTTLRGYSGRPNNWRPDSLSLAGLLTTVCSWILCDYTDKSSMNRETRVVSFRCPSVLRVPPPPLQPDHSLNQVIRRALYPFSPLGAAILWPPLRSHRPNSVARGRKCTQIRLGKYPIPDLLDVFSSVPRITNHLDECQRLVGEDIRRRRTPGRCADSRVEDYRPLMPCPLIQALLDSDILIAQHTPRIIGSEGDLHSAEQMNIH